MLLYVLFATRTYEPDSPEALDVVDEITDDCNAELRLELERERRKDFGSDLLRMEWVRIEVDQKEVLSRLNPPKTPVKGAIADA